MQVPSLPAQVNPTTTPTNTHRDPIGSAKKSAFGIAIALIPFGKTYGDASLDLFFKAFDELQSDPDQLKIMGEAGRQYIEQFHGIEQTGNMFIRLISTWKTHPLNKLKLLMMLNTRNYIWY